MKNRKILKSVSVVILSVFFIGMFLYIFNNAFLKEVFQKKEIEISKMNKEYSLQINKTVELSSFDGKFLTVKLDLVDFPELNVPGNRPMYHIILLHDKKTEKIIFDPLNSGSMINYFGFNFKITTDRENINWLKVIF